MDNRFADNREIAIIGAGPIGSILSAHLLINGYSTVIIDTDQKILNQIHENGLFIKGKVGSSGVNINTRISRSYSSMDQAAAQNCQFDIIFVCVKATVNELIAPLLPEILSETGTVVCAQNGLDIEEEISAAVGQSRSVRAVINFAGNRRADGAIELSFFNPPNYVGAATRESAAAARRAQDIATLISDIGLQAEFSTDVQLYVWKKVILHALAPVSALTGLNMAEILSTQTGLSVVEQLLHEGIAAAQAKGYNLGESFFIESMQYLRNAGPHIPSMRDDVLHQRQTEILFSSHKIAECCQQYGLPAPCNRVISDLLRSMDAIAGLRQG